MLPCACLWHEWIGEKDKNGVKGREWEGRQVGRKGIEGR